jgi:hypothetical protein
LRYPYRNHLPPGAAQFGEQAVRNLKTLAGGLAISLAMITPAFAQAGGMTEPSDLSLLALGVIGVVLGQRGARKAAR